MSNRPTISDDYGMSSSQDLDNVIASILIGQECADVKYDEEMRRDDVWSPAVRVGKRPADPSTRPAAP